MCSAPPLANIKHADEYTIEDLNADVEAFRLAFVQYARASVDRNGRKDRANDYVIRSRPYHKSS